VAAAAREAKVATQMGNHGHSSDDIRRAVEWIRDGAIGKVRQVHGWQGGPPRMRLTERPKETPPVPEGLNWDLWLGPAPDRPFHPAYAPLIWHYWWDFGSGTLGNYGCHTLDTAVWALDLGHPTMIEASSSELSEETAPMATLYHYKFPAHGPSPEVDVFWYDGGPMPPRPDCLEPNRNLPRLGGSLIVGDQGAILSGSWSESPRIIPEQKMKEYQQPPQTLPRSQGHHRDWINACKGGPPASSNFDYAAHLTELVLLGTVALRTGETIHWDGSSMRAINAPKAGASRGHISNWESLLIRFFRTSPTTVAETEKEAVQGGISILAVTGGILESAGFVRLVRSDAARRFLPKMPLRQAQGRLLRAHYERRTDRTSRGV
jgi:hypothetical protein